MPGSRLLWINALGMSAGFLAFLLVPHAAGLYVFIVAVVVGWTATVIHYVRRFRYASRRYREMRQAQDQRLTDLRRGLGGLPGRR